MASMAVFRTIFSCMSDNRQPGRHSRTPSINYSNCSTDDDDEIGTCERVKFGCPLEESFKNGYLPQPLKDLLVLIARDGMSTNDLFRRPGNPQDMKKILRRLQTGRPVHWSEYNFYTLANVVKKFLIKVPNGMFGPALEEELLQVLELEDPGEQFETINRIITGLPDAVQELVSLLFGIWFRMIHHSEYNAMRVEAVAKSVAGSVFQSCTDDPKKVARASSLMELLISNFGVTNMFGPKNVQYFTNSTQTRLCTREKYCYEYSYPPSDVVPREEAMRLFAQMLMKESERFGFDLVENDFGHRMGLAVNSYPVITEDDFLETRRRSNTFDESSLSGSRRPSTKEKKPLQRLLSDKSQHMNSISAPEVSKPVSPIGDDEGMFNSISLGRFELVRRRQLAQLQRRSNWFLAAPTSIQVSDPNIDSRILLSRLDMDLPWEKTRRDTTTSASAEDEANNRANQSGNQRPDSSDYTDSKPFTLQDHDDDREFTEKDRRYFMLERWYNGESQEAPK